MATYFDENFDGVTPPALPSGWTSGGAATIVSESGTSYSGTQALSFTGTSTNYAWASKLGATDSNYGNNQIECKFNAASVTTGSGSQIFGLFLRGIASPSGSTLPGNAIIFKAKMLSGATAFEVGSTASNGTYTTKQTNNVAVTFAPGAWYRSILQVQECLNTNVYIITAYIQRMSDGAWLYPDGSWGSASDVQTPFLSITTTYTWSTGGGSGAGPQTYAAGWATGCKSGILTFLVSGEIMYADDVIYQDVSAATGAVPASPSVAGAEVELIASATSASDGGQTGHTGANLNVGDTDFASYYLSAATFAGGFNQYALLDAGSGVTAIPTAVIWSPGLASDANVGGYELYMLGAVIEGANSSSGPWTQLGVAPTNIYPEPNVLATLRFTLGASTYRYFRLRSSLTQCCVNQFRLLVQNSGGVSWRPARPVFSPAAGRYASGQTVTITTQTTGASIYYTVGTRTSPPADPTTGSTLYSSPIAIVSNFPNETIIKAIAYHASGTTTTSAVAIAHFVVSLPTGQYSLSLNGSSQYAVVDNAAALQLAGALTLMGWVYAAAKQSAFCPIIDKGIQAGSSYYLGLNNSTTNGQIYFGFNGGGNEIDYTIPSSAFYGAWHHIAGVFTGTGLIIYLDGVSVKTGGSSTTPNVNTNPVNLGHYPGPTATFLNGRITDCAIFSSALSAGTIASIASGAISPLASSPVAYWPLNEGVGGYAFDQSGNAHHGLCYGPATWIASAPSALLSSSTPTAGFVPDTQVTGNTWFANTSTNYWPSDWYDTRGVLIQNENGHCTYDSNLSQYFRIGNNLNSGNPAAVTSYRGHWAYSSPDFLNWTPQGQIVSCYPAFVGAALAQGSPYVSRLHVLINPNPLNVNKKYVTWGAIGNADAGCWTAPGMAGPWTWAGYAQPNSVNVNDCTVFYDVVDDGTGNNRNKAWFACANNTTHNLDCCQLDPATDWTSFTGSNTTLATGGANSWPAVIEAPILFYQNGYYYLICSAVVPYGSGNSRERYASATTLAGLNSATSATIWFGSLATTFVAFNTQATCLLPIVGLTSPAFILMTDFQVSGGSPINMYQARTAWFPVSTVTSGRNVNAFPTAGTLAVLQPTSWDMSYLPAANPTNSILFSTALAGGFTDMIGGFGS